MSSPASHREIVIRSKLRGIEPTEIKGSSGDVANKLTVKLWGKGVFEKIETLSGSVNTQYYRREAGQFIYSKLDFLNQAFGVIPAELDGFESTVDLPCFDISKELHTHFLLEYVKRPAFYEKFGELADGGRKAKRIQAESFLSFPIRVPGEFHEQQKIAECLSTLDELIGAESQKLDALKAHKKGLMRQLFPREGETLPRLRFPEFQSAPAWNVATVQDLIDKRYIVGHLDGNHGELYPRAEEFTSFGIPYITASDFADGVVNFERCRFLSGERALKFRKGVAKDGDVLFAHNATVGPVAKLSTDLKFVILSTTATYFRCNPKSLSNDFLKSALASPAFVNQYSRVMAQSTRNQVPITSQRRFFLQIPQLPEQHRIASCLSSLDDLIAAQTDKLSALKTHKQGLMQQLFPSPVEVER